MNTPKRITKLPKVSIDEDFFTGIIERHSTLHGIAARGLATALLSEMRSAIGRRGGRMTKARYGAKHYSRIGKMGGRPKLEKPEGQ